VLGELRHDEEIAKLNLEMAPLSDLPPETEALSTMEWMLGKALRKEERV